MILLAKLVVELLKLIVLFAKISSIVISIKLVNHFARYLIKITPPTLVINVLQLAKIVLGMFLFYF